MASYYDKNPATSANARDIILSNDAVQHFPSEGLFLGSLIGNSIELPALYDIRETNGLCFLYRNESQRMAVNRCIEKLVWRIALTVPSGLCDLLLYNGGNPGDAFGSHLRINKELFGGRMDKVFFDSNVDVFKTYLNDVYTSIVDRMSTIRSAGKKDLVELNESLGNEARIKYQFIFFTDFPRHLREDVVLRLAQIVEAGKGVGIYVIMSWNMNADFEDSTGSSSFNPQQMLSHMELLLPQDDTFQFRNTGHDEVFNKFNFVIDGALDNILSVDKYVQYLDIKVETDKKLRKPTILKQDFKKLEETEYVSVTSEISASVGLDIRDKRPISIQFTPKDYIHSFILGQSGSGKSVLLNNIITSLALKYSPADLMLYLMDFKGVEFNRYRGLKHTKAVLVDNSDPQMTLEVLRELNDENKRRQKLFGSSGVNNIDGYNRKNPAQHLPQVLFVADECQVMFKVPSKDSERVIFREMSEILNTIATQGRSQGIHMVLATQQLDETEISGQILKNLTECFLMMSAPNDSDKLVDGSSALTRKQMTGLACYYHKLEFQGQVQTFFATDEELESAIAAAQKKAKDFPGNGEYYFCGSAMFYLEQDKECVSNSQFDCPIALVGRNIGIKSKATTLPLRNDFSENILLFGANKEEQAAGVAINAIASLMMSHREKGVDCDFIVIDCLVQQNVTYKQILNAWKNKGLCRLIPRQESGKVLHDLVQDILDNAARPTLLTIIGQERFIEMKRGFSLLDNPSSDIMSNDVNSFEFGSIADVQDIVVDETAIIPDLTEEQRQMLEQMDQFDTQESESWPQQEDQQDTSPADKMTYLKALEYILEEGPLQGVHTLLLVDKPGNIRFDGDYFDSSITEKFRHKIILRSENKYLVPMRFSQDIDVESISDEIEHMRAYYYPDGDDPVLFTPYQMPNAEIV